MTAGVTSTKPNGTYTFGESISIVVPFTENVSVSGQPIVRLATRTGGAAAPYASGSGTKYLSFTYVVASGDFTNDLDYASSAALELNGGRILLDGRNIAEMPRHELRSRIGMVLQDTWLFDGTIYDNLAYGRPTATRDEVLAAAKAAYVDRFVHSLPDGYDTVLDGETAAVSAGEKQLLTIARAFLSDPSILILDEATSSVDTRTEVLIQRAMHNLRASRTSFVIAHRLSTIRDATVILVMENGNIVEQGSHEELLAAKGAYHRLYQAQFTAPVANDA